MPWSPLATTSVESSRPAASARKVRKLPRIWATIASFAAANVLPAATIFVAFSEKSLGRRPAVSKARRWPPKGASTGRPGLQTLYDFPIL